MPKLIPSPIDSAASLRKIPQKPATAAESFLKALSDRGVDCLYVGAGTDTAPVIEAYARQEESGLEYPRPIVTSHENVAVGMAHGQYMVSGRPQAVMLHVSVGAANALCGIMNAARAQVPMFFTAGRSPLYEKGRLGSRITRSIGARKCSTRDPCCASSSNGTMKSGTATTCRNW